MLANYRDLLIPRSMRTTCSMRQNDYWPLISRSGFSLASQLPIDLFPTNMSGSSSQFKIFHQQVNLSSLHL
jgi:hypothetical protein